MTDLFIYGSLRHPALIEVVLGRSLSALAPIAAHLPDHVARAVKEQPFPAISAEEGGQAPGLLLRNLSDDDMAALNFYEGGFDYDLRPMEIVLADGSAALAEVYFPAEGLWETDGLWDLDEWAAKWGALSVRAAQEVMAYRGRMSAADIAEVFPSIRKRAGAWLAAQARPGDETRDLSKDVIVHRHKRAFVNFFAMEEMDLQFRRYDGSMSEVVNRCAALAGHASVVLPYDPVRDEVILIEQFRAATFIAGEPRPWMWEPVAGMIDPGETAEATARREAEEEAGVTVTDLDLVGRSYPSSGASGEFIHIFVGLADFSSLSEGGGVASEHEDIRRKVISFQELIQAVDAHAFQDMPLMTAALWLARHRDRLRA